MSDADAETMCRKLRWPDTHGEPVCPHCGGLNAYECRCPNGALRFRCRACRADFTITSGTLFAFHKLPLRGYLAAIAVVCNEVKGKSALALSRDLNVSYSALSSAKEAGSIDCGARTTPPNMPSRTNTGCTIPTPSIASRVETPSARCSQS